VALSLAEASALSRLAHHLYDYLSGTAFDRVAASLQMRDFWTGGSKQPAITTLLEQCYEYRKEKFCQLVEAIVHERIRYRSPDGRPLYREDITELNQLVAGVGFKIPGLWDPRFLDSLPRRERVAPSQPTPRSASQPLPALRDALAGLGALPAQERGYAFERFLSTLFDLQGLAPRSSFKLLGEQLDGSVVVDGETYLLEAKWQSTLTQESDLLVLSGKVSGKAKWSRGLFISYTGFAPTALEAFNRGKPANLIGMTGQDLFFVLDGTMTLLEAIRAKVRWAEETGEAMVSVQELALRGEHRGH